ncbi:MAG: leucine-rich repeat protein [Prevotella sp.]|nr:leucine-rich repeat protein [Prevotella sp.]
MKKTLLLIAMLCMACFSASAQDVGRTILPWGTKQAWEMKYVFFVGTDSEPEADGSGHAWYEEDYNDESWETLSGPIANLENQFSTVNTIWNNEGVGSSSYCLRRTFTLDEVDEQGYTFLSQHDDNLKVWLNGELVVDAVYDGRLDCHHIPASKFHEGDNTMAIFVSDFGGEAFLDYNLGQIFFLKNVETGKYLNAGNAWGTHAVLADEPLPAQLTKQTDGSYTIFFPYESWNQQLLFVDENLADVYVDYNGQESPACRYWTITDAGNGNYHIQTLNATDTYLGNNPDKEALDGNGEEMHNQDDVDANTTAGMNITWTLEPEGLHTAAQAEQLQALINQAKDLKIDTELQQSVLNNDDASYTEMLKQIIRLQDEIAGKLEIITFEDPAVGALCGANWGGDDFKLNVFEAGEVTDLGVVFKGKTNITSFNELRYFTGLKTIGCNAFNKCTNLKSVMLPEGLTTIEGTDEDQGGAFARTGLEAIQFPSTLTAIGNLAFQGCESLTSIDFNGCTATLEGDVFSWCSSLQEVNIPNTITLVGYHTFACCEKLETVVFEEDNPSEGLIGTFGACGDPSLKTVVLPSTAIMGDWMFTNCTSLESVTFLSGDPGDKHFANNFQGCPDDVLFTIPEGTAESYLKMGYRNLSDKGALGKVKELFENQVESIYEIAYQVEDGEWDNALNAAKDAAYEVVNATDDYLTVYAQIEAMKDAAKTFLVSAPLTADLDVTAAMITNADNDYFDMGWTIGFLGVHNGWQGYDATYTNGECTIQNFLEGWQPGSTLSDGKHSQVIRQLPAGKYRLVAKAIASNDDPEQEVTGVSLFMGDQSTPVATATGKPEFFTVEFTNPETQDVEIGLKVEGTTSNWVAVDDFILTYLGEENLQNAEISENVYYIKNVETGKYLNHGNAWNMHAVLSDEPMPVHILPYEDGYKLFCPEGSQFRQEIFRADESNVFVDYQGQDDGCSYWTITTAGEGMPLFIQSYVSDPLYGQEVMPGTYLGNNPTKQAVNEGGEALDAYNDVDANIHRTLDMNVKWVLEVATTTDVLQNELADNIAQAQKRGIYTEEAENALNNEEDNSYWPRMGWLDNLRIELKRIDGYLEDLRKLIDAANLLGVDTEEATQVADNEEANFTEIYDATITLRQAYIAKLGEGVSVGLLPLDVTCAIANPSFSFDGSTDWDGNYLELGFNQHDNAECYGKAFDLYQTINGLPNGIYKLRMKGFKRGTDAAYLYANDESVALKDVWEDATEGEPRYNYVDYRGVTRWSDFWRNEEGKYAPNSMKAASIMFDQDKYENELEVIVTDGTLTLGVKNEKEDGEWVCFDDFRLEYLGEHIDVTDVSEMEDVIYMEELNGLAGRTIPLVVNLRNTKTAYGCTFNLVLPEGFSLKEEDETIVYSLANRAKTMSVTPYKRDDHTYQIVLMNYSNPMTGNDGAVITLQVQIPDDAAPGDYKVSMNTCMYEYKSNGTKEFILSDIVSKLTVGNYIMGDVNNSGSVTPADAIMILYHFFGVEQNDFKIAAADLNGDGIISPADAIEALYLYFSGGNGARTTRPEQKEVNLRDPE